jgi:hypothetical protein
MPKGDLNPVWKLPWLSATAFLIIRGFLLWIAIPVTFIGYILLWPLWRKKQANLGQLLGWVDLNLVATLMRSVFRPFVINPRKWTSIERLPQVIHRISFVDPL